MITRKLFYWIISILLIAFIGSALYIHSDSQLKIDLVKNELKSSDMQVGIWQTEYDSLKIKYDKLQKENEQLYGGIEANTLILDYTAGLLHSYKIYTTTLQNIMDNNNVIYPEFIYKGLNNE